MTEEKELIKKRGSFKGRLTSFINHLDALSDEPVSSPDITELQLRVGKIESLYDQYDEVQLRLECIVEDVKTQLSERSEFESQYYKALSRAQNLLIKYNKHDNDSVNSDKNTRASNRQLVKLPTIQLPKFNGSYSNWLEFRDTFTSLIHSNDEIDEINKFHYLRASLEGSAAVVIHAIEFSARNYLVAWNLLCDRFDNKRLLVHNHVSALFNIETITKESSTALKGLIDQLNKNLRALESLGEPVKYWDTLIIYIVTRKVDQKTFREWEQYKSGIDKDSAITLDAFLHFMRNRADLVETLELSRCNLSQSSKYVGTKIKSMVLTQNPNHSNTKPLSCPKCKAEHNLDSCPQFLALSTDARLKLLPTYKVCYNCFRTGHYANRCRKPGCQLCKRRHNTLIHSSDIKNNTHSDNQPIPQSSSPSTDTNYVSLTTSVVSSRNDLKDRGVLLSTALVKLFDNNYGEHVVRAVLDSGSTSSFITKRLCNRLNLTTTEVDRSVFGINNVTAHIGKTCDLKIKSLNNRFEAKLYCFVLPSVTNDVPCRDVNLSDVNIPTNICLADPTFYKPDSVDLLIGADLFWDLLGTARIRLGSGKPVLCDTRLGWIVSGPVTFNYDHKVNNKVLKSNANHIQCNFSHMTSVSDLVDIKTDLARFWQLEEVTSQSSYYSPEERSCEKHFVKHMTRLKDGRFCVRIPTKQSPSVLGNSYQRAIHCFYSLERRLKAKPNLCQLYCDFMSEYKMLGHMTEITEPNFKPEGYFIPHHAVLRESSATTKLRVVFNASCPTSSGVSFNDIQMVGPTVQDDLLSILIRFRQHKYVLSADVEKMYRQVVVHPSDRHLQRIVWRDSPDDNIKIYELNTVTYGTTSAPFLATRCLKQIGLDCKIDRIAEIIQHDFYVDDLLTGADSLDDVKSIRDEVTNALASAGMPLRKWKSNETHLVSDKTHGLFNLGFSSEEPNRLLGLDWFPNSDEFSFLLSSPFPSNGNTKRDLLSVIARIFDPLGLLSPCIVIMKMLLQRMWLDKLSWDEPLSPELKGRWSSIISSVPLLNSFRIPRIVVCDSHRELELHVFTDASERAYGACVYMRSINEKGECMVRLLLGKSRVAPIKPTTIPRLELCGAVVGAHVYEKVSNSLRAKISRTIFWTDSTIVLGWLQMLPSKLQPFVRNRVAEVLEKTGNCIWRHVPTDKNPADLISRGVDISVLQGLELWWCGPSFLIQDQSCWPSLLKHIEIELPETRTYVCLATITDVDKTNSFIDFSRFSNYLRLVRCVAYVLRFIKSCRKFTCTQNHLSQDELQDALHVLIIQSQRDSFPEYELLLRKRSLPKKSALLKFNVYLDTDNVMRVGGRLDNSQFVYSKRHPSLLQSTHSFTKLLFNFEHKRLMHAGPQLLLASIRETYWPIGGRNLARACYRKCVRCQRLKGKVINPLMGNLPQQRLIPGGYAFESVGVDYAGPILCASRSGRGCRLVKAYIAIFICFATKAIHLELVGDLTSNKYLLALYRFIARRGKPINIYSDNGTSFVGAYNDLSKFLKTHCDSLGASMANDGIKFHFIPAYTPHFGGLWEAGVKSTKYHLQRVLGNCHLTFEELYTTLTQIEAILNSRPLTPISSDPADCSPLTPGHFLIGRPPTSLPQPDYQDRSSTRLTRFQRIEQLRQHFWSRWSKEFVAELQQRTKWRCCKDGLKLETLVVIKEDHLPPLKWRLGRIVAVHPGADGIARVADIRTSTGIIRRAFNRICPLPVSADSG